LQFPPVIVSELNNIMKAPTVGGNQGRILKELVGERLEEKGEKLQEQLFYHLRTEERPHILPPSGPVFPAEGRVSTLQRLSL
jgi:hypothetical protein